MGTFVSCIVSRVHIRVYAPTIIMTYADRSWSNGNLYRALGFTFVRNTKPNYKYCKSDHEWFDRSIYERSKLDKIFPGYDTSFTEEDIMFAEGYDKVYDSGSMLFEMKL